MSALPVIQLVLNVMGQVNTTVQHVILTEYLKLAPPAVLAFYVTILA